MVVEQHPSRIKSNEPMLGDIATVEAFWKLLRGAFSPSGIKG
jgi:hypothetical protein